MPNAAILGTALSTQLTKAYSFFIDGNDVMAPVGSDNKGIAADSIRITEGGYNSAGSMEFIFDDPAKAYSFPTAAETIFFDWVQGFPLFGGFLDGRVLQPGFGQIGRSVSMTCTDYSPLLDLHLVPAFSLKSGVSDRDAIQALVGYFGGPIGALSDTVASTNSNMPALSFIGLTLRQAIEKVANAAGANRVYWLDSLKKLNYTSASSLVAPYVIKENPVAGNERAPEDLTLEYDDHLLHGVYVQGANQAGSGYVWGTTKIPSAGINFTDYLSEPDSDTAAKRNLYGAGYLGRVNADRLRGSFRIAGTKGWQPGEIVTITNAALGLTAQQFLIVSVESTIQSGSGYQEHDIRFGSLPKSLARLLGQQIGGIS